MNIINIGGWYVGNSAILDWMDGFEELAYIKGDLNLLRLEDGIMDMISAEDSKKKLELISLQMHKIYLRIFVVSRKKVRRELRNLIKSNKIYPGTEDYLAYYFILIKYLKEYKSLIVKSAPFHPGPAATLTANDPPGNRSIAPHGSEFHSPRCKHAHFFSTVGSIPSIRHDKSLPRRCERSI